MTTPKRRGPDLWRADTPERDALERLANRWTVLIVNALEDGPTRFNDLRHKIGISAQVLTRMLRDLERDGFVARAVYAEVPVRVEYTLTELGGTMCPVVRDLRTWAETTAPAIEMARAAYDAATAR